MKTTYANSLSKSWFRTYHAIFLALVILIGETLFFQKPLTVPEFPQVTDPQFQVSIEEEETPLASAPKITIKTNKKTSTKNVKLAVASKKTYTKKLPTTKKTTTKKSSTAKASVTTQKTIVTDVTEKYVKKSKVKKVTTTVTTTVKTTTVAKAKATPTPTPRPTGPYNLEIDDIAPKMDSRVLSAYKELNFTVVVEPSVNYSGYFNSRNQSITLNGAQIDTYPDTIYHELGHFLAFIAGCVDTKPEFVAIYNEEKSKLPGVNSLYASQSSSEFFAECVRTYTLSPNTLKTNCPKAYAAIGSALELVTDTRIAVMKKVYAPYWTYK